MMRMKQPLFGPTTLPRRTFERSSRHVEKAASFTNPKLESPEKGKPKVVKTLEKAKAAPHLLLEVVRVADMVTAGHPKS